MKRNMIKAGMLAFGFSALLCVAPSISGAYFHGGGGCWHGGCWGCRGPVVGIGFYGGYPGWYGYGYGYGYPYPYPYPYPYGYPYAATPYGPGVAAGAGAPVRLTVHVPPDADVWFNGNQTQQKGPVRQFMTPPVAGEGKYEVRAAWRVDGQVVTQARTVNVAPGMNIDIDFASVSTRAQAPPVVDEESPSVFLSPPPNQRSGMPATPITFSAASSPVAQAPAIHQNLKLLSSADEAVRQRAVMDLGRLGSIAAIDPLTAVLAGDASPQVREAAARALGLIADSRCLPGLIRAAQADDDREVRHSAQFAVEAIRSRLKQN